MQQPKKKIMTLCLIHQHPKILLGMKKRGFGKGRWNGFGGKIEEGETIEEAAVREINEEIGVHADRLSKRGIIEFEFQGKPEVLEVHIFKVEDIDGEPIESEEMKPQWFHVDEIPFKDMWKDDVYWMPLFFQDKKFTARFLFDENDDVLEHQVIEVQEL